MEKLILHPDVTRAKVWALADNSHWSWWDEIEAPDKPYEIIWYANVQATIIHYIEDDLTQVHYFVIRGDYVAEVSQQIRDKLAVYNHADFAALLALAESADDYSFVLYRLGIAAPITFDPEYFDWLRQGLTHTDAAVRAVAVGAASYVDWEELKAIIRQLAADDPDEAVRATAATLVEAYDTVEPPHSGFTE